MIDQIVEQILPQIASQAEERCVHTESRPLNRRAALRLLLIGGQLAILAACTGTNQAAPTSIPAAPPKPGTAATTGATSVAVNTPAPAPAASAPKTGGILRMGQPLEVSSLDGHLGFTGAADTLGQVFDRLTEYDAKLVPQPRLAESWEFTNNLTQLKLNLRKNVQFHTGRELTSDDIKWNMLRVRDPKTGLTQLAAQSNWWNSIDTPDKYTVVLASEVPRPFVFDMFESFNIVDPVTMQGPDAKTKAVGTGPFAFEEWLQGDHFSVTRNKNYWQTGKPYLDGLRVVPFKAQSSLIAQLEAGSLDVAMTPSMMDYARLQKDATYGTMSNPQSGSVCVVNLNTTFAPLDQKSVRQALNYAINRQRFIDVSRAGVGNAQALPWSGASPAYEPEKNKMFAFDLDKARSLLNQASVSGLTLEFVYFPGNPSEGLAEIYQADLAAVGVTMKITPVDPLAWRDLNQIGALKYKGISGGASGYANFEPVTLMTSSTAWNHTGNSSGYTSERYSSLINSASTEPDLAKRKQAYSQLNDLILDESFVLPVAPTPEVAVFQVKTAHGLKYGQHGSIEWVNAWLGG
jgi:peptide/nickel transport system substrate-binding protein